MTRARAAVLLAAAALLAGGCSGTADRAPAPEQDAKRAADVDAVLAAYDELHPEPPDLEREAAALRERAASLTDEQWLVELMRLTAGRDRDGHTGVFPLAQEGLGIWPLQLYAFADGWRVVAAQAPYVDLVGGEVTAIGGVPVEQAAELAAPLVPRDNDLTVRARVPQSLVVPDVLVGLGLEPELTVDGRTLTPEPVTTEDYASWSGTFYPLVVPRLPPTPEVDLEVTTRGAAVVLGYHRVTRASGDTTIGDLADAVEGERVVVDLRRNPGGENGSYPPLLAALQEQEAQRPGSVRLLVGRSTFSAATQIVAELLAGTDALAVGEPMGGSPNMWGDAQERTLPASGTTLHMATRWWELGGADPRTTLEPDVAVPVAWADWSAGRDLALEAALAG